MRSVTAARPAIRVKDLEIVVPELALAAEAAQLDHRQGKIEPVMLGLLHDLLVELEGRHVLRRRRGDQPAIVADRNEHADIHMKLLRQRVISGAEQATCQSAGRQANFSQCWVCGSLRREPSSAALTLIWQDRRELFRRPPGRIPASPVPSRSLVGKRSRHSGQHTPCRSHRSKRRRSRRVDASDRVFDRTLHDRQPVGDVDGMLVAVRFLEDDLRHPSLPASTPAGFASRTSFMATRSVAELPRDRPATFGDELLGHHEFQCAVHRVDGDQFALAQIEHRERSAAIGIAANDDGRRAAPTARPSAASRRTDRPEPGCLKVRSRPPADRRRHRPGLLERTVHGLEPQWRWSSSGCAAAGAIADGMDGRILRATLGVDDDAVVDGEAGLTGQFAVGIAPTPTTTRSARKLQAVADHLLAAGRCRRSP